MSDVFQRGVMTRPELKEVAKLCVRENQSAMIGVCLLVAVIISVLSISAPITGIAGLIIFPLLEVASAGFWLKCWKRLRPAAGSLFQGFFENFGRKVGGMLWMELKVFLWFLLFVIPGIIKTFAYSMTHYLLAQYPAIPAMEASVLSDRITRGYKMDLFVLGLSFLGWFLLSGLTFGILHIVYVGPYYETTMAGMYDELIRNALQEGRITQNQLDGEMTEKMI